MEFLLGVGRGAPVWVWPLLVVMLILGWRSSRDRRVRVGFFFALPFLGLISLGNAGSLPNPGLTWPVYLLGYGVGATIAHQLQNRWIVGREGGFLIVKGEWLTLAVLMVIFWANFVRSAIEAISPATFHSPAFLTLFTLMIATASGSFLGRAVCAIRQRAA